MTWYWISLPWACFGLGCQSGRVIHMAPIAKWTLGKPEQFVLDYFRRKGAEIVRIR